MTIGRERLSRAETVTVAAIEAGIPLPVEGARYDRRDSNPGAWEISSRSRSVAGTRQFDLGGASFANGVSKDKVPGSAASSLAWSNSQIGGQITKLKLVKRQ